MEKRLVDVVVISDVHLGTYGCRARELVNYLKSITPNILILNGDIIDGWQFTKRYFPVAHMMVIKEIIQFITNGTRVFYITGNHDEMMRRYTDIQMGNFTLTDKLVLEIDGKMTWIFHGDVFDNTTKGGARFLAKLGSSGYSLLIRFNRFVNFILKALGRERVSISKRVMAGVNKAVSKINDLELIAAENGYTPLMKIAKVSAGKTTTLTFTLDSSSITTQSTVQSLLNNHLHIRPATR